jgi:hypothetical protein
LSRELGPSVDRPTTLHKISKTLKVLKYVGCYEDKSNKRDLNGLSESVKIDRIENCIALCKVYSFAYAGVQNGLIFNMNVNDDVVYDIYFILKLFQWFTL